jgi:hypothetical protein
MDRRKVLIAITLSATFYVLFYREILSLIQRTSVHEVTMANTDPFIWMVAYTAAITVVSSAIIGVILVCVLPLFHVSRKKFKPMFVFPSEKTVVQEDAIASKMTCVLCGMPLSFYSKFCHFYGKEPGHWSLRVPKFYKSCGVYFKYSLLFFPSVARRSSCSRSSKFSPLIRLF